MWPAKVFRVARATFRRNQSFEVFSGIQLFSHFCVIIMFVCGDPRGISGKNNTFRLRNSKPSHNNVNVGNSFEKSEYRFEMSESLGYEETSSFNNVFC